MQLDLRRGSFILGFAGLSGLLLARLETDNGGALPEIHVTDGGREEASITPCLDTESGTTTLTFSVPLLGARFRAVDLGLTGQMANEVLESRATVVVNGGFFDGNGEPEGLVLSGGMELSPRDARLGGGILTITDGRAVLHPAEDFIAPSTTTFAIQARPRLVVNGAPGTRDAVRHAERTALCARDGGRTVDVIVVRSAIPGEGPTLAQLAANLAARGCSDALNLDGGPSTGVAWRQGGKVHVVPPRGPLRFVIAISLL